MTSDRKSASAPAGQGSRRLAETVAGLIEKDIVKEGLPAGAVLGSERELIERYGVSRAVFREAVRLVERHQMARMRRGPGGGLVVTEPDPGIVRDAARVYLRHAAVSRRQLLETRTALELAGVATATERLTESGIARLTEALDTEQRLMEQGVTRGHARNLHSMIAELAGNPAVLLFVEVLAQLDQDMVQEEWEAGGPPEEGGREAAERSHQAHRAIVAAIVAGDAPLAQHRMRRHLQAIAELLPDEASE